MYKNSGARERVLRRLLERGASTVDELADDIGVVPVTMRSHLAALQEQGLVEAEDERGHVGRPRRRYSLTLKARAALPTRTAAFAADLLDCLQALAGTRGVEQLLDVAASRYATRHAREASGSLEQRVVAVTELLTDEGGLAQHEQQADEFLIHDFNCPYGAVADEREAVCRYHTQVVTRLVGAPVRLERSIPQGDLHCVFAVQRGPVRAPAVRTLSDGRVAPARRTGQ